jgi:kynurenine formamidase
MLIDLSHAIESGMPVFPGDPEVLLSPAGAQAPWNVTALALGSHTGTHIDAASHYVDGGRTIDGYPLDRFIVDACVARVDAAAGEAITWPALAAVVPADIAGKAVLLATGWDRYWGADEATRHPYLSKAACRELVTRGVGLVGTDALNVDGTAAGTTDAHEVLLSADVLIVENLTNLAALAQGRFYRCAFAPLAIAGGDGSPIRAFAWA